VGLINQLLASRVVSSSLGSSTLTRHINRGTPQGGILSPLLWNIVVNELLCDIEGGGCQVVAYADDVAIIFAGKYPQILCDLMTTKPNSPGRKKVAWGPTPTKLNWFFSLGNIKSHS